MTALKLSPELRQKVIELLKQNKKIAAVQVVFKETRAGLANSKEAVDKIAEELHDK